MPGVVARGAPRAAGPAAAHCPLALLFDFDKTLTDWDCGERVAEEFAPETRAELESIATPANFIPATNAMLHAARHAHGATRSQLESFLHSQLPLPAPTVSMLRAAAAHAVPVTIVSDCNSVLIAAVLRGSCCDGLVQHVVTNPAAFDSHGQLVVAPRHAGPPHRCPRCPDNLCKGLEVARIKAGMPAGTRIAYGGDGANDVCAAASLGPEDVVLARAGYALARALAAASPSSSSSSSSSCSSSSGQHDGDDGTGKGAGATAAARGDGGAAAVGPAGTGAAAASMPVVSARVLLWHNHQELERHVSELLAAASSCGAAAAVDGAQASVCGVQVPPFEAEI